MSNNLQQNEYTGISKSANCHTPLDKAYDYICFQSGQYYKGINTPTASCLCSVPFKRSTFDEYQEKGKRWPNGDQKLGWRIY